MSRPAHPEGPLAQQITRILATPSSEAGIKQALHVLDTSFDVTPEERNVRTEVELRVLDSVGKALDQFEPIYQSVSKLSSSLNRINETVRALDSLIKQGSEQLAPVAKEAATLLRERREIECKRATIREFTATFIITEEEEDILSNPLIPVDDQFFSVLDKANRVQQECQNALVDSPSSSDQQTTSNVSRHKAQAYEKLKLSIQQGLKSSKPSGHLKRQLSVLADQPLLFREVLGEMAESRKRQLTREFSIAISNETEHGKALDFYSYDPVRYLGSLLAWVHSAIVSEYENLSLLVDSDLSFADSVVESVVSDLFQNKDAKGIIAESVDSITAALDVPLRQKVRQLISIHHNIVVIYQLANVVAFYETMLSKYDQTTLTNTLKDLHETFEQQVSRCVAVELDKARSAKVPRDLGSPDFWLSILATLKVIVHDYETGMASIEASQRSLEEKMKRIIEPLREQWLTMARGIPSKLQRLVFELNCLDDERLALSGALVAEGKVSAVEKEITAKADELKMVVYEIVRSDSGLDTLLDSNDTIDKTAFYETFDNFVSTASDKVNEYLSKLASPQAASSIGQGALTQIVNDYKLVADEFMPRSVDEVEMLLGC